MATNDKNDLIILIDSLMPDNNTGEISPEDLRTVLSSMVTADLNLEELTQQIANGTTYFAAAGLTPQLIDPAEQEGLVWYDAVNKTLAYYSNLGKQLAGDKVHFIVATKDTIPVPNDPNASGFFTGYASINSISGFEVDAVSGSVRNVSGRTIGQMGGTISFSPSKSGGTTSELDIFSERSSDKITWTKNINSARSYQITNTGQSFRTTVSFITNWQNNEYVRFKFFSDSSTLSFASSAIVADGDSIDSYSSVWDLIEV